MLYELPQVDHVNARTVKEAVNWLKEYGDEAKVLGGGTDLLGLMKDAIQGRKMKIPRLLVNIKSIPELGGINWSEEEGLRIGAAVTLRELERSPLIRERFRMVADAASQIATIQIRNMGTVGGNLCQRPWCWYFRLPYFDCYKKGGSMCYAITGEHRHYFSILGLGVCVMAHPSDLAPPLIALGSSALILGPDGSREMKLENFFLSPREVQETALRPGEMLTEIRVPKPEKGTKSCFIKDRIRHAWDFALSSAAVVASMEDGVCKDVSVVLGGVAPFPYKSAEAGEFLRGKVIDEASAEKVSKIALKNAHPLALNKYKISLTEAILKRALLSLHS